MMADSIMILAEEDSRAVTRADFMGDSTEESGTAVAAAATVVMADNNKPRSL
jgi:hypothetical protein